MMEHRPARWERRVTELDIERLAYGGDAVGRMPDGRAAFVKAGCPGDRVAVKVIEDHERFVRTEVVEILSPATGRTTPRCPYFGQCGGCAWQHLSQPVQLEAKRLFVVDALRRIGHIDNAEEMVGETVPSSREYGYRNKIELVIDPTKERVNLGYHRAGSEEVVIIDECPLLPPRLAKAPKALGGALRYLAGDGNLDILRVAVRVGANTRDVEVALWTSPGAFPRSAVAKTLAQALPTTSVVRVLTKGPMKERRVAGVEVLGGRGCWRERLAGRAMSLSAPSFFQINTAAAEVLVGLVTRMLQPDGTDRVLDLYSGAGTFTLPLAELAGEVVCVEAAGSAVKDLRRNLEDNEVWADVIGGDAAREIAGLGHFDLAVVDPPRSGLDADVVHGLAASGARTIAYVSCDPATLARDAKRMADAGYTLMEATPVDLFPQTYHVETVARFERLELRTD